MNNMPLDSRKKLAAFFDALGHHRRVLIVQVLQKYGVAGLSFGDLAACTDMTYSNLTHHLNMLKKGGVLASRTKGNSTILTLSHPKATYALSLFETAKQG